MARAFTSTEEELRYLAQVKTELDAAASKEDVARIWQRHYLRVGHKKLGRLLPRDPARRSPGRRSPRTAPASAAR